MPLIPECSILSLRASLFGKLCRKNKGKGRERKDRKRKMISERKKSIDRPSACRRLQNVQFPALGAGLFGKL